MNEREWLGEENVLGIDIWNRKYRYNNESFDKWVERVSNGDSELQELIINKKFLFGGRILSNRGLEKQGKKITLSNCYVITPPQDNIESIFDSGSKLARTFSYGGGCGIDIGNLRPRNAKVNNAARESTGAVSFMDLYSNITATISQNGRRGALMISIPCDHPDIEEFIEVKSDLDKITKANVSIRITNEFMNAVKSKDDYNLTFTLGNGDEIVKTVKAHELFSKICLMNWDYAEPGMLFWDRISKWNLLSNTPEFSFAGVNPCVAGDTLILTDMGYQQIQTLIDTEINVWNGYQFSKVTPQITGHNQNMKRITFSDGSYLDCTLYHKFILKNGDRIEAKDLSIGDKLIKHDFPIIDNGATYDDKLSYTQGFFMGDGSLETLRNRASIKLYGEKRKLIEYLQYEKCNYCKSFNGEFLTLKYNTDIFNKTTVPSVTYSIKNRLSWLAGYIDSDGSVNSPDGALSISSVNKDILMQVKLMLNTLGCTGKVTKMHDKKKKKVKKTDIKEYLCQKSYRLLISAFNVKKLMDLGLRTHRVLLSVNPNRDAGQFVKVKQIDNIDMCESVYCFNEPINHSGVFNGVITAQCAEEPLPAGGSCLLGSINLAEFVENPYTINARFNFEAFKRTVKTSVRALNKVLDEGVSLHPLEEQRESVQNWRQIGLGIMGLADMLIKLGVTFGDPNSIELCDDIGFTMMNAAIRTSARLAKDYGSYPHCNIKDIVTTPFFINNSDDKTKALVEQYGLRNSQLLTIAPTGSLSTMLGISGGIEPIFANYYTRKTESLHNEDKYYKIFTPIAWEYLSSQNLGEDENKLPEYFVTSQELEYHKRVDMQAIWQKHIDASISSTVNVPNKFSVDDVKHLYMYAWESGLKGLTIYRNGCKRSGVLSTDKDEIDNGLGTLRPLERGYIIDANEDAIGKKRRLQTGCGSLHCVAFFDPINGDLLETYLSKGSAGGCTNFMVGLSRMISLASRGGICIESIVDQLNSCGSCPSYAIRSATKHDTSKGSCCPAAVGNALKEMYDEIQEELGFIDSDIPKFHDTIISNCKCPECGAELIFEGGCNICKSCGWTKCE